MGARWYDSELGRWVSPDTIVPDPTNPQGFNRYSYVVNNPLKFIDPTGHKEDGQCGLTGEDCPAWYDEWLTYAEYITWEEFLISKNQYLQYAADPDLLLHDILVVNGAIEGDREAADLRLMYGDNYAQNYAGMTVDYLLPPEMAWSALESARAEDNALAYAVIGLAFAGSLGAMEPPGSASQGHQLALQLEREQKYLFYTQFRSGSRTYYTAKELGRVSGSSRYALHVDASENVVWFRQEIFDDAGNLVEVHVKRPVDTGHIHLPLRGE
jgi:hypothetical protein